MTFFRILWAFDAVIALVVLYFFFEGLADGTVSSFNAGLWFLILAGLAVVLGGSLLLKSHQHLWLAKGLLWVLAIPGLLFGLFTLIMIIAKPRWN